MSKLLDSKYLSIPLIVTSAVWLAGLTLGLAACSHIGSTTSTTVPVPLPSGVLTPDCIVVV